MTAASADYAIVPELWAQGISTEEIGARLGVKAGRVSDWAYRNRHLCPKRCNVHVDRRAAVTGASTLAKRTILVPVVPNTGITQSPVSYTPVSVAAFSWDAQA